MRFRRLPRSLHLVAAVGAVLLAVGLAFTLRSSSASGSVRPFPAVEFDLPDLRGSAPISFRALRGRPVVLNFFDSTCTSCVKEMPALDRLARGVDHRVGDLAVVGVDVLEERAAGLSIVERVGIGYPVAHDREGTTLAGYRVTSLPTTVFIDRAGTVRSIVRHALSSREMVRRVGALSRYV